MQDTDTTQHGQRDMTNFKNYRTQHNYDIDIKLK